jgi:hypothetical protein
MNRLKKLAGVITEDHGHIVAEGGEFHVELDGDVLYFYDGEATVRMEIPVDDMVDIINDLVEVVPEIASSINTTDTSKNVW